MTTKSSLLALGLTLGTSFNAQAALTSYTSEGVDLVYSSVSDVTWTKDANLLGTMFAEQGFSTVVNAIIAVTPIIFDSPNYYDTPSNSGYHVLSAADFNNSVQLGNDLAGRTSWYGALAFANYLNSINYGGSDQWRLPTFYEVSGSNQTIYEMGQLFYDELGGTAGSSLPNTPTFDNEPQTNQHAYWTDKEMVENPAIPFNAWVFHTYVGAAGGSGNKGDASRYTYAWAVTPGQVATVPVPAAVWLFGSALAGLGVFSRRKAA